jgi:hypothetical protein
MRVDFQHLCPHIPAFVAQGIEHRSPKAGVAGSNPAGGTRPKAPDRSWSGAFDIQRPRAGRRVLTRSSGATGLSFGKCGDSEFAFDPDVVAGYSP